MPSFTLVVTCKGFQVTEAGWNLTQQCDEAHYLTSLASVSSFATWGRWYSPIRVEKSA